jgi:pyruvate formate lyase activating enzyme
LGLAINGDAEARGVDDAVSDGSKGCVVDIQRYAVHDGPGIRTVVFFKGCPLRCAWCHNPDAIVPRPEIAFVAVRCIGCGACLDVCPRDAIRLGNDRRIDRDRCDACLLCVDECMSGALSQVGDTYTVVRLLAQVLRDLPFYEESGGGVTLSGGEPLLQHRFTAAFLAAAKQTGLHTVIETCGHVHWGHVEAVLRDVDLVYFDLKLMNAYWPTRAASLLFTPMLSFAVPLSPAALRRTQTWRHSSTCLCELRQRSVHLLPYHDLGEGKLARVDSPLRPLRLAPLARDITQRIADRFEAAGIRTVIAGSA